jgi:hypothetical protein
MEYHLQSGTAQPYAVAVRVLPTPVLFHHM